MIIIIIRWVNQTSISPLLSVYSPRTFDNEDGHDTQSKETAPGTLVQQHQGQFVQIWNACSLRFSSLVCALLLVVELLQGFRSRISFILS